MMLRLVTLIDEDGLPVGSFDEDETTLIESANGQHLIALLPENEYALDRSDMGGEEPPFQLISEQTARAHLGPEISPEQIYHAPLLAVV